jgi:hypothetical protein
VRRGFLPSALDSIRPACHRRPCVVPSLLVASVVTAAVLNTTTSEQVSRRVVAIIPTWPAWTHPVVALAAEGGLLALAGLLALVGWRARTRGPRPVATALLEGVDTVVAT